MTVAVIEPVEGLNHRKLNFLGHPLFVLSQFSRVFSFSAAHKVYIHYKKLEKSL